MEVQDHQDALGADESCRTEPGGMGPKAHCVNQPDRVGLEGAVASGSEIARVDGDREGLVDYEAFSWSR